MRIIAEPGRFFVASAFTLAVNVIARRAIARDDAGNDAGIGSSVGVSTLTMSYCFPSHSLVSLKETTNFTILPMINL